MKPPIQRLLGSLLIPPALGAVGLFASEEIVDGWWRGKPLDHAGLLFGYLVAAPIACLIPGLMFWGVFEGIWKKRPTWGANRVVYAGIGALLGLLAGVAFALFLGLGEFEAALLLQFPGPGAVIGFATAWFCRGARPQNLPG